MPTDILIYGRIDEYSATAFFENVNEELEENPEAEIVVRINSEGGSPEYTWGMIAKFNELTGKKSVKNDGKSYSMGLYFNCYVENAIAYDTTQFILHRAAYSNWIESDPEMFSDSMRSNLENINKKLRAAFEAKVDVSKFENLKSVKAKGITLDKVFSMDSRIDVALTAKEAKQIGLINEVVQLTPSIKAEIESHIGANASYEVQSFKKENLQITQPKKQKPMTIETLKAEHPALFAQIVALGVDGERNRVAAAMVYNDIDPIAVKALIESGKDLSQKDMAEFGLKATHKMMAENIKKDSPVAVVTAEVPVLETEKEKATADFLADVKAGK